MKPGDKISALANHWLAPSFLGTLREHKPTLVVMAWHVQRDMVRLMAGVKPVEYLPLLANLTAQVAICGAADRLDGEVLEYTFKIQPGLGHISLSDPSGLLAEATVQSRDNKATHVVVTFSDATQGSARRDIASYSAWIKH
jgi:hypothetical protein